MIRTYLHVRILLLGIFTLFIVSACSELTTTVTATTTLSPTATLTPTKTASPTPTKELITPSPTPAPVPISVPAYIHPDLGEAYDAAIGFDAEKLAEMERQQIQLERLAGWLVARPESLIGGTKFTRLNEDLFTFQDLTGATVYIRESDLREIGGYRENKDTFFVANYVTEENPTGIKQIVKIDKEGNPFVYLQIIDPGSDNHLSVILPYYEEDGSYWQPGNTRLVAHGVTESIILAPATDNSDVEFNPDFGFVNVENEQIIQVFSGVDEEGALVWAEIPEVPEGADPEIWQAGCLAGLVDRRVKNSELVPSWDATLGEGGTVVWKRGENVVWAYNSEFDFAGKPVGESQWIVKHQFDESQPGTRMIINTEIADEQGKIKDFGFHLENEEFIGEEGIKGAALEMVGMVTGIEEYDFTGCMERTIADYTGKEQNMPTHPLATDNVNLARWRVLKVRTIVRGEPVEVGVLVSPTGLEDYPVTLPAVSGTPPTIEAKEVWKEPPEIGSMIRSVRLMYTSFGDSEQLKKRFVEEPVLFIFQAMGGTNLALYSLKMLGVPNSESLSAVPVDDFVVHPLFKDSDGIDKALAEMGPIFTLSGGSPLDVADWKP